MTRRFIGIIAALGLVAAACGAGTADGNSALTPGSDELVPVSYGFAGFEGIDYSFDASMHMETRSSGAFAGEGDMTMDMAFDGIYGFDVAPGAEEGTYDITMSMFVSDLEDISVSGMGELSDLDKEMLSQEMTTGFSEELTVTVDEFGNLVSSPLDGLLGSDLFSGTSAGSGSNFKELLGPALPPEGIAVGSEWTDTETAEIPGFGDFTLTSTSRVVDRTSRDGRDVFVIETDVTSNALELDFVEMVSALADAGPEELEALGMTEADLDDMEFAMAFMEGLQMDMTIEPMSMQVTSWLDTGDGLLVAADMKMDMDMSMNMSGPPEMGGDFGMDMTMFMDLSMELLDAETVSA